jgi:hypothetical protein
VAKRQIILSFEDTMWSVFVYAHDGEFRCTAPIVSKDVHADAVSAVPAGDLVMSTMDVEALCDFIRKQYAAHSRPPEVKP